MTENIILIFCLSVFQLVCISTCLSVCLSSIHLLYAHRGSDECVLAAVFAYLYVSNINLDMEAILRFPPSLLVILHFYIRIVCYIVRFQIDIDKHYQISI